MKSRKGCLNFLLILIIIVIALKILSGLLLFMGVLLPVIGLFLLLTGRLDRVLQKLGGTRFKLNRIHGFIGILIISMLSVQIGASIDSLFKTDNTSNVASKVDSVREETNETKVKAESEEKPQNQQQKEKDTDSTEQAMANESQEEESSDTTADLGSKDNEADINESIEDSNYEDESYTEPEISEGGTVYWTPNGKSYHTTSSCPTLSRSKTILSGTQAESGKYDPCDRCH